MSGQRRSTAERKQDRLKALLYLAQQDTDAARLLAAHISDLIVDAREQLVGDSRAS